MDIRQIIHEEVNKLITEGYSGKIVEKKLEELYMPIYNWLTGCYATYCKTGEDEFSQDYHCVFQLGDILGNEVGNTERLRRDIPIMFTIIYRPTVEIEGNIAARTRSGEVFGNLITLIDLCVCKEINMDNIMNVLLHECTHVIDKHIQKFKGTSSSQRVHQPGQMPKYLPVYIQKILYMLWDTNEFNAWQVSYRNLGDLSDYVQDLMNCLELANRNNNKLVWRMLKNHLVREQQRTTTGGQTFVAGRDLSNTPLPAIKKYFITTSFNKLKKFIKKVKL